MESQFTPATVFHRKIHSLLQRCYEKSYTSVKQCLEKKDFCLTPNINLKISRHPLHDYIARNINIGKHEKVLEQLAQVLEHWLSIKHFVRESCLFEHLSSTSLALFLHPYTQRAIVAIITGQTSLRLSVQSIDKCRFHYWRFHTQYRCVAQTARYISHSSRWQDIEIVSRDTLFLYCSYAIYFYSRFPSHPRVKLIPYFNPKFYYRPKYNVGVSLFWQLEIVFRLNSR